MKSFNATSKIKLLAASLLAGLFITPAVFAETAASEPAAPTSEAAPAAGGEESNQELAKKLSNPVASLISIPFQLNYNQGIGPVEDGSQWTLNIQPVVPISISEKWNMISRTIVPVITQSDVYPGAGSQFGLGDTTQSLFFSPKAPTAGGLIWGVGPALLIPTGTDSLLGTGKWAIGPTAVVLKQHGPWTVGMLGNYLVSIAGAEDRSDVSAAYLQPFVSYSTPKGVTYSANTESTYNFETDQWSVPVNFAVTKVMRVGHQLISVGGGAGYYAESADNGAQGWKFRMLLTFLFPK